MADPCAASDAKPNFRPLPAAMKSLEETAADLRLGKPVRRLKMAKLLQLCGYVRRKGYWKQEIQAQLAAAGLTTEPDFTVLGLEDSLTLVALDGLSIMPSPPVAAKPDETRAPVPVKPPENEPNLRYTDASQIIPATTQQRPRDAVLSLGEGIPSAREKPATVRPEVPVNEALTRMVQEELTILVVQKGDRGRVDGIFTFESYAKAVQKGEDPAQVKDCLSHDYELVNEENPLIGSVRKLAGKTALLVQSSRNEICGMVTPRHVAEVAFHTSEPFLLVEQIERKLRTLLNRTFLTAADYQALVRFDEKRGLRTTRPEDLTLGELIQAISRDETWAQTKLKHDKSAVLKKLQEVNHVRNHLMHFKDGEAEDTCKQRAENLRILEQAARLF